MKKFISISEMWQYTVARHYGNCRKITIGIRYFDRFKRYRIIGHRPDFREVECNLPLQTIPIGIHTSDRPEIL